MIWSGSANQYAWRELVFTPDTGPRCLRYGTVVTGRRQAKGNSELTTIYWRDIPAQVIACHDNDKESLLLTPRFQNAINRSAGVAGLTEADDYIARWRREVGPIDGEISVLAKAEVDRLEAAYTRARLELLVRQGGADFDITRAN